jgi:hypothetical protein
VKVLTRHAGSDPADDEGPAVGNRGASVCCVRGGTRYMRTRL